MKISLNRQFPDECALLEQLDALPTNRHGEFLRRLVLIGFRQDQPNGGNAPSRSSTARSASAPMVRREPVDMPDQSSTGAPDIELPTASSPPSLASLRQLIG